MIQERFGEARDSSEYDPRAIETKDCGFYTKLLLPVRQIPEKPGRDLVEFSVEFVDIERVFGQRIVSIYDLEVEPGQIAGGHYHREERDGPCKTEAYRVIDGKMILELVKVKTGKKLDPPVVLERIQDGKGLVVIVPPGIAHRIINAYDDRPLKYIVYSTAHCSTEDEIPYKFDKR